MREEGRQGGRCTTKLQRILDWAIVVVVAFCDSFCDAFVVGRWDFRKDSHGPGSLWWKIYAGKRNMVFARNVVETRR
jgi:hypothetical protein